MTCPQLGEIVIGAMDSDSRLLADQGLYKRIGSICLTDSTLENNLSIDGLICYCQARYSEVIERELFSYSHGRWTEYSEEEIKRLAELAEVTIRDRKTSQEYDKTEIIVDEIRQLHRQGELRGVTPLWHTDIRGFHLDDQPGNLDASLRRFGMEIILNVNFEKLLDNMFPEWAGDVREQELFHECLADEKTAVVIHHWMNHEKLIPPTITFEPRSERNLYPSDGKHRINAAYYLGVSVLPILVLTVQKDKILSLLYQS